MKNNFCFLNHKPVKITCCFIYHEHAVNIRVVLLGDHCYISEGIAVRNRESPFSDRGKVCVKIQVRKTGDVKLAHDAVGAGDINVFSCRRNRHIYRLFAYRIAVQRVHHSPVPGVNDHQAIIVLLRGKHEPVIKTHSKSRWLALHIYFILCLKVADLGSDPECG